MTSCKIDYKANSDHSRPSEDKFQLHQDVNPNSLSM